MKRPTVIIFPVRSSLTQLDLAAGIETFWAFALHASGAHVYVCNEPLDDDVAPQIAIAGATGRALMHDGMELDGSADAFILAELIDAGPGKQELQFRLDFGEETTAWRKSFRKSTGLLTAITQTLRSCTETLSLSLPPEIGWRDLLGVRTLSEGILALEEQGREARRPLADSAKPPLH